MKGKRWLAFQLSALALIVTAYWSAFLVKPYSALSFWLILLLSSGIGLLLVLEILSAQRNLHKFVTQMDREINLAERDSLYNFPAPAVILDADVTVIWYNQAFAEQIYSAGDPFGMAFTQLVSVDLQKAKSRGGAVVGVGSKHYRIKATDTEKTGTTLSILYFEDVTEMMQIEAELRSTRPSVMLIMIDNYEDLMANAKESEKANVLVQLEKLFETFMSNSSGILKKLGTDRFIAILEEKQLSEIIEKRFKILDEARAITVAEKLAVTLSIGVGKGASSMAESETLARQALDMALGRGGDQAAVKTDGGFEFFGGVSKGIEKHAKVKTRIIATALKELVENSDKVYIMGHKFGDLDSIGSASGLAGALQLMGHYVRVVVDPDKNLANTLIERIKEEQGQDFYITPATALEDVNERTLLIIVDTHNKGYVESPELYNRSKHVVVIDHHRKTVTYIENAVIFHHEPYASSASEMVAELIQHIPNISKLPACFAEALLAGITLDTKNFVMRTGVRTFEAAAFLKKLGADTVSVRGLFASTIDSYQKKTRLVSSAEIYNRCAIAVSESTTEDIRVVAAQAADELLNVSGVDASFVIHDNSGVINISARSMGAMNVQIIMEKLGGGGHQTMAGAQLDGITIDSGKSQLLEAIDAYIKESS